MKFLCLGYLDDAAFDAVTEEQKSDILRACFAQCVPFRATGKVVEEEAVEPRKSVKSIRPKNGRATVTDGSFLQSNEQLGSFFIIEADNIDEAVAVASLHPAAILGEEYGFGIEVRPIQG